MLLTACNKYSASVLLNGSTVLNLMLHEIETINGMELTNMMSTHTMTVLYSLWSLILTTLFYATRGNFCAIHIDYVDFVPELGWRFRSRNL